MNLTRVNPYSTTYDVYGDPDKLTEFRLFSLNHCDMQCKGCFYNKLENNFTDFNKSLALANSLEEQGYVLESCFLLPTDIFDNKDNFKLFENEAFRETLSKFRFVGVASTLEEGFDEEFFEKVFSLSSDICVELQLNLSIKRIFEITYETTIRRSIHELKALYGKRVVINLAINTGFPLTAKEIERLKGLIKTLSEDGILELNFTFLFNGDISPTKKRRMMAQGLSTVKVFGDFYEEDDSFSKKFTERTFLSKPAFSFIGDKNDIYAMPILPFDEHVFVESDLFKLPSPDFFGFLQVFNNAAITNAPLDEDCVNCDLVDTCLSKHYFSLANAYDLKCFLTY